MREATRTSRLTITIMSCRVFFGEAIRLQPNYIKRDVNAGAARSKAQSGLNGITMVIGLTVEPAEGKWPINRLVAEG